jgi:hypothetical protein
MTKCPVCKTWVDKDKHTTKGQVCILPDDAARQSRRTGRIKA